MEEQQKPKTLEEIHTEFNLSYKEEEEIKVTKGWNFDLKDMQDEDGLTATGRITLFTPKRTSGVKLTIQIPGGQKYSGILCKEGVADFAKRLNVHLIHHQNWNAESAANAETDRTKRDYDRLQAEVENLNDKYRELYARDEKNREYLSSVRKVFATLIGINSSKDNDTVLEALSAISTQIEEKKKGKQK